MRALTPSGRVLLVAALVLGVGAARLEYPELVVLAIAALAAVALALVWTSRDHPVEITRTLPRSRVSVGQAAEAVVTVMGAAGGRGGGSTLWGVDRIQVGAGPVEELSIVLPAPAPGEPRSGTMPLPTGRRGIVTLGPLVVDRFDPLGLARRTIGRTGTTTLWVHPRVHVIEPPAGGRRAHPEGGDDVRSPHATTTFESLREYVVGDDLRRIHWRSTAHAGALMVRNDLDTATPTCVVWLDTARRSYATDKEFEESVEVAASVVVAALGGAVPVRLTSSAGLDADGSRADRSGLLDRLATVELDDRPTAGLPGRLRDPRQNLLLVAVTGPTTHGDAARIDALCRTFGEATVLRVGEGMSAVEVCRLWNRGNR